MNTYKEWLEFKNLFNRIMKLELKHLSPYLPYKLKVSINKNGWDYMISSSSNIAELVGLYGDDMCLLYQEEQGFDLDFEAFELILHPLSDLTKQIEVNEEKFVPIVELAKIGDCHFKDKYSPKTYKIDEFQEDGCNIIQVIWDELDDQLFDMFEMSWGIDDKNMFDGKNDGYTFSLDSLYLCHNVGTIYQKLFEWHFDIFKLIEKNLAIDINTL